MEFFDERKQFKDERAALSFCSVFDIYEGTQGVHFIIEGFESWIFGEEVLEAEAVKVGEVVDALAKSGEQASVVLNLRGDCWV